jgi:hypothetical protein
MSWRSATSRMRRPLPVESIRISSKVIGLLATRLRRSPFAESGMEISSAHQVTRHAPAPGASLPRSKAPALSLVASRREKAPLGGAP